jgi:hypothetical protein
MHSARMYYRDGICLAVFAGIYAATFMIVGTSGDFPLNDDWSFALTLRKLVFEHEWHPVGWASMSLITQSLWAAPACLWVGCSFDVLRVTTIIAGLILGITAYTLSRMVAASRGLALLVVTSTVFNPIVYALTYTFMTDVLFTMLLVVSALFYVRALDRERSRDLWLATVTTIAATLCRQLGLCLPIAFLIVNMLFSKSSAGQRVIKSMLPLILSTLAYLSYDAWMRHSGRAPALYDQKTSIVLDELRSPVHAIEKVAYHTFENLMYLGLFCLPVCIALSQQVLRREHRGKWQAPCLGAGLALACAAAIALIIKGKLMPLGGNVLSARGIGPVTLKDAYYFITNSYPSLPAPFWAIVTVASAVGAWLVVFLAMNLVVTVWRSFRLGEVPVNSRAATFMLLAVSANLAPLTLTSWLDRYPAVVVPLLGIGLLPLGAERRAGPPFAAVSSWAAGAVALALAAYSVLGTHDYLSWNRARWQAIAAVESSGEADAQTMDGGFEYNGYRSYDPGYLRQPGKSQWWVTDDAVQITFGPLPGTQVLARYPFTTYLPPAQRNIYVLARKE